MSGSGAPDGEAALLARLLAAVSSGDRVSFERLYARVAPKLYGVCLRILSEPAAAEDALQEAFLSIWRQASSFDESRGGATTWLVTIARNRALDRYRASRRGGGLPIDAADDVADPAASAETLIGEADERGRLRAILGTLAAGDERLLRAAFFEGATYAELATRAGLPLGTVKSRIRRALLKLREALQ